MILAIFYVQVVPILPIKFPVSWPSSSGEDEQNRIGGHGTHLGFQMETILATFDLQVAPIPPTKVRVDWPFSSGEEAQFENIFYPCPAEPGYTLPLQTV